MSLLFKLLSSFVVATCISIFITFISIYLLAFIVEIFKLNNGKDAYWIFSVAFYASILAWIASFGCCIHLMDK